MRVHLRIVAGELRGRKLHCTAGPDLRPTPQRVREAFFSIMGNAIPDRLFVDVFAGTGVIGLEALSRGASEALFVERDHRHLQEIERHLRSFDVSERGRLLRTDAYAWAQHWQPPPEPVNVFVSPPFADYQRRPDDLVQLLQNLMDRAAPDSVIVLQAEKVADLDELPFFQDWEKRTYGRNILYLWQKAEAEGGTP